MTLASGQLAPKRCHKIDGHKTLQHIINTSTVTKQVEEILTPLKECGGKRFVRIEGAPTETHCMSMGKEIIVKNVQNSVWCIFVIPTFSELHQSVISFVFSVRETAKLKKFQQLAVITFL